MIRFKIIDIIRSAVGSTLRIDNLAEYKETYSETDMDQNTLVPYGVVQSMIPQGGSYEVPFTNATAQYVINWQTDLIDGVNTFASILGNNLPKSGVLYLPDPDVVGGWLNPGTTGKPVRVAGLITTVTFDIGSPATGIIVF